MESKIKKQELNIQDNSKQEKEWLEKLANTINLQFEKSWNVGDEKTVIKFQTNGDPSVISYFSNLINNVGSYVAYSKTKFHSNKKSNVIFSDYRETKKKQYFQTYKKPIQEKKLTGNESFGYFLNELKPPTKQQIVLFLKLGGKKQEIHKFNMKSISEWITKRMKIINDKKKEKENGKTKNS